MKLYEICFSPTGGTKRVADILSERLAADIVHVDLTDSFFDFSTVSAAPKSAALIAVPSYGGRMPEIAVDRLSSIKGNGAAAIIVCVYGNRAYEDTLVELEDTAKQAGFKVIGAVAAVAEHSIVRQFAAGRPDDQDHEELSEFAGQIWEKLSSGNAAEPIIPGHRPYKKAGKAGMVPKPTKDCTKCGLCAEKCPVQAIDRSDPKKVDKHLCISCMRCVAVCPHSARKLNGLMLSAAGAMLKKVCSERKEYELYL